MPLLGHSIGDKSSDSCEIMGPAGTLVQIAMGLFSFLILTYKRTMENPKREWAVWALDTSKQGISGGVAHILNVISAILMTAHDSEESTADSCAWYLVTMLFDTMVGTLFNIAILLSLERLFIKHNLDHLKSGNYFTERDVEQDTLEAQNHDGTQVVHIRHVYIDINYLAWTLQLIIWCLIVSLVKTCLFFIQLQLKVPLGNFGAALVEFIGLHGFLKLIFVLVFIPTLLNSIQFWITDNFLKKKSFTAKEFGAKSAYFKMDTRERDKKYKKAQTSLLKATMGQSFVLQVSRSPSPRHETLTAFAHKPTEVVMERRTTETRRTKSV